MRKGRREGGRETRGVVGRKSRDREETYGWQGADGFGLVIQVTPGSLDIRRTEKEFFRSSI